MSERFPRRACPPACPAPRRLSRALCSTVLAVAALSGCAGLVPKADDRAPAVAGLGAWREAAPSESGIAADRADTLRWWDRFAAPTLSRLVAEALAANPNVESARAAWRQARAQREVTAAGLLPTLDASASAQRGKSMGTTTRNQFGVGLDAAWELDLFGGNRAAVRAADADAAASAASLADVQVSLAAEVALDYLTLRGAEWRLAIARDNLASQQETLQLTEWRREAGLASSVDVEQARTAVEQTRAQVPALQQSIAQTLHALAVLTGRPPAALAADIASPEGRVPALPEPAPALALALPADTLRQRPDVRQAEQQIVAAAARVDQAEAARLPSFSLSGSLGLSALRLGSLTTGQAVTSAVLGSVSAPLFDGGARRAQVAVDTAQLDQARASYRATVLTALQEVEDALVALQRSRERLAALQAAAEAADSAALLARQRYGSGLIDFQTVLTTQRTLLTAQDAVASARTDLVSQHVQLYKALGGGWQPESPPDAVLGDASSTTSTPAPTAR